MASKPAKMPRPPNLVVLLPDQQRADTVARTGQATGYAPNLDRLASQSTVFERVYVTQPVCSPSRSSLLSGTWPHANGVTRNSIPLPPRIRVLPELLSKGHYQTAYLGKWHLGQERTAQRGFETWVSTEGLSDYQTFLSTAGLCGDEPDSTFSLLAQSELPLDLSKPRFLEREACRFLDKHRGDPFILFVAFAEPHSPYNGPLNREHALDAVELDTSASVPLGENLPLRYRLLREWQEAEAIRDRARRDDLYYFGVTPQECRRIKQRYLGLVTLVDLSIGAILAHLERLDLADNTIVVHTSDHGDMMGAHQLFAKEVMFEEAVRVPYLVHLPGQRRAIQVKQAVSHIDFIPTLLELLGEPVAEQCAGRSRCPFLYGEPMAAENVFIEWSPNRMKLKKRSQIASPRQARRALGESTRTIISPEGWKLSLRDRDRNELYHLRDDPSEIHNLYSEPRFADVVRKYSDEIRAWQKSTDDQLAL